MKKIHRKSVLHILVVLVGMAGGSQSFSSTIDSLTKTCAACHGEKGVSNNGQWPNLAGQKSTYLADQLRAFKKGKRIDPLMGATARGLSEEEIVQLSTYYASLTQDDTASAQAPNQAGKNIRARCISCHGMQGKTVNDQWPNINAQQKGYLQKQLMAFRDGSRHSEVMKVIVKDFSDQQIADVAEYYSQLEP